MRFDRDHLTFKALCALDEAIDQCDAAPIKPTFALRFALAYLFAVSDVICPLLSGPKYLLFWIMKEIGNAVQEAQAGRDHWQAA